MTTFLGKLPRSVGGTEQTLVEQYDLIEAWAVDDGSTAWNRAFMASSAGIAATRLPDETVAELLAKHGSWPSFCGTFPMSGHATRVEAGYRLTGRWGFGSGIREAAVVVCGALVAGDRAPWWFVLPVASVVVHDTWDTAGLGETHSCDYSIDDVFVPERFTFDLAAPRCRGGPLFRMPVQAYLTPDHTGITLGCARARSTSAPHRPRANSGSAARTRSTSAPRSCATSAGTTALAAARAHVRSCSVSSMPAAGEIDATLFTRRARAAAPTRPRWRSTSPRSHIATVAHMRCCEPTHSAAPTATP